MNRDQRIRENLPGAEKAARRGDGVAQGGVLALLPAALMLVAGLSGLALATLFSDGVEGQFVVISPPWEPAVNVVTGADGGILGWGGFSNVMVAASDRPDFAADLHSGGAWLVLPAPRALGCSAERLTDQTPSQSPWPQSFQHADQQAGSL